MGGHGESDVKGSSFSNCEDMKNHFESEVYHLVSSTHALEIEGETRESGILKSLRDNAAATDGPRAHSGDIWRTTGKAWNRKLKEKHHPGKRQRKVIPDDRHPAAGFPAPLSSLSSAQSNPRKGVG